MKASATPDYLQPLRSGHTNRKLIPTIVSVPLVSGTSAELDREPVPGVERVIRSRSAMSHFRKARGLWAIVLLSGLSLGSLGCRRAAQELPPGSAPLNESAVRFATYAVVDDIEGALTGSKSLLGNTPQGLLSWASIDGIVTAREYETAYDDNEISADNQYKGKRLLVSGTIARIEKDFSGEGNIWLRGSGLMGIHAALDAQGTTGAAIFTRGQRISLVCQADGEIFTVATLTGCEPLDGYLDSRIPRIQRRIRGFLEGRTALPATAGQAIAMMYAIGTVLPVDSPCFRRDQKACSAEMDALLRDPSVKSAVRAKAQSMLKALKVS